MKPKVTNAAELDQAIEDLKKKSARQKIEMQEAFHEVTQSLKPANLVKNGMRSVLGGEGKTDILNALIGIGSGMLGRKLLIGRSSGIVKKTLGKVVQWGMAGIISRNAEKIKEKAGEIIDKVFKKHNSHPPASSLPEKITGPEKIRDRTI
jgi:hypothetical protein